MVYNPYEKFFFPLSRRCCTSFEHNTVCARGTSVETKRENMRERNVCDIICIKKKRKQTK